jgi:tetratricopeptide (TPR) repeat protein
MSAILVLLLLGAPVDEALAKADALAAAAKAAPPERQAAAVDGALAAYDRVIALRPKDLKLVPRVRRRRVTLLRLVGRPKDALQELDRIVEGPARRKDKARALREGAALLEKGGDFAAAEARLARALDEYGDDVRERAKSALARGRVLERMARPSDAAKSYRFVLEKCRDEAESVIAAYDALALMAIAARDLRAAQRWLRECRDRFEKRATRGDRYGAMVGRLLAGMKAPVALAKAMAEGADSPPGGKGGGGG